MKSPPPAAAALPLSLADGVGSQDPRRAFQANDPRSNTTAAVHATAVIIPNTPGVAYVGPIDEHSDIHHRHDFTLLGGASAPPTSAKQSSSMSAQSQSQLLADDYLVDTDAKEEEKGGNQLQQEQQRSDPHPNVTNTLDPNYHSDHEENDAKFAKEGDIIGVHDDVEFITEVEWAPADSTSVYGELATRPKPDPMGDPCGCTMPTSDTKETTTFCCMDPSCILFACQEECRSNCEAGPFCGNKRIQRKLYKAVEVFHAGPKGRGLRVLENVQKGDFIMEYVGRAVRASYLAKLFQRYKQERRLYIMALDTDVYLDARKKGSVARYINHSCEPNCVVERWKVRGILRAGIFAKKDIPKGTELSFDYQWERKKGRAPTKCHCGVPSCRGTLEVPKSLEEQEFEKSYEGHWKVGSKNVGREIINRSIRILSKEHQQYFYADICKFDETTRKHLVIYRYDWEEVWEDLSREEWQLLDEDFGQNEFVIAKKARPSSWRLQQQDNANCSASGTDTSASEVNNNVSGTSLLAHIGARDTMEAGEFSSLQPYLYVQTPVKEAFWAKHLVQRCERNCRVTIQAEQFARSPIPPNPKDPDEVQKHKALEESSDGSVWKLSVSGYNVAKACTILKKNVTYLTKLLEVERGQQQHDSIHGVTGPPPGSGGLLSSNLLSGSASNGALASTNNTTLSGDQWQEVVIPRCVVDIFKRRLPFVREKCRSVNISFSHSESKSKAFARLLLEATLQSDMHVARDTVWSHLNSACAEANAPKVLNGFFYRDLGFLGGELTGEQFRLLFPDKNGSRSNQDCQEDLRWSSFLTSFQSSQRCTVWIQAEDDKGRIDGQNNIVGEAVPNAPRKVYFGCDPKDIKKLWGLVRTRAVEIARGVKYLYLGADRVYQPFMMQNGGKFFDYVKRVTSASVTIDHMTGDHLRIDGSLHLSTYKPEVIDLENDFSDVDRVALAGEIIRLQIEIYRDHCIRQQNWIFGRDWSLSRTSDLALLSDLGTKPSTNISAAFQFDEKIVTNSCQEIADIALKLGPNSYIGAGAAIIFYRFIAVFNQREDPEAQPKVREIILACIFLANKAQKGTKWKRLDAVLEAAYQVFYPGAHFDGKKEEALILGEKVLLAESVVLNALKFDVFWRGTGWIIAAAMDSARLEESLANEVLAVVCSGPFLAAGPKLWLKYGIEYVFAAAAGFLRADIEALCPALSLIPLKVLQAAELIAHSVKVGATSKRGSSHALFEDGKGALLQHIPRIKEVCVKCMAFGLGEMTVSCERERRYRLIGSRDCRRHVIRGVPRALMKGIIVQRIDGASAESKCNIYIGESAVNDADDIVLEGSWRAIAIAEYLLRQSVSSVANNAFPAAIDISVELEVLNKNKLQAKVDPGLLNIENIYTADGWNETIQSQVSGAGLWGKKAGGKICVAGKLEASSLLEAGLRWWIPPQHGPSPTGSICDMFLVRSNPKDPFGGLQDLAESFLGESKVFPKLGCLNGRRLKALEHHVAVSLQRWPSEKVESREIEKAKKYKQAAGMGMGFSAAALQELQLLGELHSVIPSPQGHPNIILPVALALPQDDVEDEHVENAAAASTAADDIFSLFRTSEQNERVARREKKMKDFVAGPHLVFQPSPFLMQRFVSTRSGRCHDKEIRNSISPAIFSAWVHDLLSALVHCHTNNVVLRSFQADQIIIDHSGVAKLGGLYRATVISTEEQNTTYDLLQISPPNGGSRSSSRSKRVRKGRGNEDDDVISNPYIAPEHLFGSSKHTKESDIWSLGCLLANILLSKPFYSGKDRQAMLNSMYKVVGTPARKNFERCARLPHYTKPPKKYKRGVEKAFQHILKEDSKQHTSTIDLISKMLHLDPNERITALDALQHRYILDYLEKSSCGHFRQQFVDDWICLKKKLKASAQDHDGETQSRQRKRKTVMLDVSHGADNSGGDADELYDLDDLLCTDSSKKLRLR